MSFLSLSFVEAISLAHSFHCYSRDETWSKRSYLVGIQALRIDILNTVREEVRDKFTMWGASLDNLMVVSTLMLSIGFGFAVEGTFPPAEHDGFEYSGCRQGLLVLYASLAGLSLAFPLLSLMLTVTVRFEVAKVQKQVLGDIHGKIRDIMFQHGTTALHSPHGRDVRDDIRLRRARGSGQVPSSAAEVGGARAAGGDGGQQRPRSRRLWSAVEGTAGLYSDGVGVFKQGDIFGRVERTLVDDVEQAVNLVGTEDEQLGEVHSLQRYYPAAVFLLWLGMVDSCLVCCVLLGLYFQKQFPNTPWMWRAYSGILLAAACGSTAFLGCWWRELRETIKSPEADGGLPSCFPCQRRRQARLARRGSARLLDGDHAHVAEVAEEYHSVD
mmetsp:Transcript_133939/g.303785  ORF Transcript_133939/g.303785 Transcript_133939/m.303785 type:complete len:384 (+) Transcript_133939:36-1187(+)